jgi:hypothetical protein
MSILHVNDFVSHDPGKFGCASHAVYETREDINGSSGDGKGVELGLFDDKETIVERLRSHDRQQPSSHSIDISLDFYVVDKLKLLLCFTPKFPADLNLFILLYRLHERNFGQGIGTTAVKKKKEER